MIRIYSTVFSKLRPGRAPSGKNFTLNISMSFLSLSGSPDIFQRFYRDFGGYQSTFGVKYSRMDQVKFFEGCLLQISFGPFLNTLSHLTHVRGAGQYVKKKFSDLEGMGHFYFNFGSKVGNSGSHEIP